MDDTWRSQAIVLSVFGFLRDFRPSDPFMVQFLTGKWHNLTSQEVNQDIFPVGTYSYGTQLVITFLITDYFRYKPLLVLAGIAGMLHWATMIWCTGIRWLQLSEVFYGTLKAADVAFWSYIYARVDRSRYQKITSYTKSSSMVGKFVAAVGSQALLFYGLVDYLDLNYVTMGVQVGITVIALCLPAAPKSIYFNRRGSSETTGESTVTTTAESADDVVDPPKPKDLSALELLWFHVKTAYTNCTVLRYSIWYALSSCVYYQTVLYVQVLWRTIGSAEAVHWNGAVEGLLTLCGAVITFSAGYVPSKALKLRNSLAALSWISFAQGGILLAAGSARSIWVAYGCHILYSILHSFTMTLLSSEIAKHICRDSFGLIFGINATVGSLLQMLLTIVAVDGAGLFRITINWQFALYGAVCWSLGVLFCVFWMIELKSWWRCVFFVLKSKLGSKQTLKVTTVPNEAKKSTVLSV
ncbi:thiamine transporter 1-like [Uranotaenia lowii]|uniref:thiamine transporter 1-like n=1 Tax=Uranotaenia lowii TaxID=190385 RepID=UPI00247904FC|nr:thiamine transporter 1-like [Uranotaenia lowii]